MVCVCARVDVQPIPMAAAWRAGMGGSTTNGKQTRPKEKKGTTRLVRNQRHMFVFPSFKLPPTPPASEWGRARSRALEPQPLAIIFYTPYVIAASFIILSAAAPLHSDLLPVRPVLLPHQEVKVVLLDEAGLVVEGCRCGVFVRDHDDTQVECIPARPTPAPTTPAIIQAGCRGQPLTAGRTAGMEGGPPVLRPVHASTHIPNTQSSDD